MQIAQQEKEKKVQIEDNQFVEINRIDDGEQNINNYQDKLKQLDNKINISLSKIQFNIIEQGQKAFTFKKGSASSTNIRQLKNKKKKVIIQEVSSSKQNNFRQDKINFVSSCKQLERNPSLKKITKFQKSNQGLDQTNSWCLKRVKFDQNMENFVILQKNDEKMLKDEVIYLNKFYKKIKVKEDKKQVQDQNFMHFLCSFLSFKNIFRKRNNNKLQKKILRLNQINITGSRQQIMMLKLIGKFYLLEQLKIQDKSWSRIGFKTQKPLEQLQKAGVLVVLQWINFIVSQQKLSTKIFNFCLEMSFSLFQFHLIVTQVYCRQLTQCKFSGSTLEEYQQIFNLLVVNSSGELFERFKNKPENIQKIIPQIVSSCGKKLKIKKQKKNKKKSVKISQK